MKWQKGQSGNSAGRPKGSKNVVTEKLREDILHFLDGSLETIRADFETLKPYQRIRYYIELLNFGLPKYTATTFTEQFERMPDDQLDELIKRLKGE